MTLNQNTTQPVSYKNNTNGYEYNNLHGMDNICINTHNHYFNYDDNNIYSHKDKYRNYSAHNISIVIKSKKRKCKR